jgi:hypothetical protein
VVHAQLFVWWERWAALTGSLRCSRDRYACRLLSRADGRDSRHAWGARLPERTRWHGRHSCPMVHWTRPALNGLPRCGSTVGGDSDSGAVDYCRGPAESTEDCYPHVWSFASCVDFLSHLISGLHWSDQLLTWSAVWVTCEKNVIKNHSITVYCQTTSCDPFCPSKLSLPSDPFSSCDHKSFMLMCLQSSLLHLITNGLI